MIRRIVEQTTLFVTGAISFVAALAWNDAIRKVLEIINRPPYGVFTYAITVTIIAIAVSIWLGKINYKYSSESDPRERSKKYKGISAKMYKTPPSLFSRFSRK
ncbi:hypothetical protein JW851_00855 [Candidatus Woesearchaeota archaeon]|nr:hypothetical protein [Candidatus Woesearchaeota archaeon]